MAQGLLLKIVNPYPVQHEAMVSLVPGQKIQIGRSEDNDVVVINQYVSREHLLLFWNDSSRLVVRDLKSLNGTRLNGQRLKADAELKIGDELQISNVRIALLPGLGATEQISPEAIEAVKVQIASRTGLFVGEPELQGNLTLHKEAPSGNQSGTFKQTDTRKGTMVMDRDTASEIRRAAQPRSLWFPVLFGLGVGLLMYLLF